MTTKKLFAVLCVSLVAVGCGEGDASDKEQAAREAAAREADAVYKALISDRSEIVEELQSGAVDAGRRAELEAKAKRLSEEIRNANQERLRRDQEEVRRQILEKKRGGK